MRLFIAVPLPKDVQRTVFSVQEELRECSTAGRFVPQGNHHITVRFLGESSALVDIADAMHEAVRDARPFTLRLGALGSFSHGGARTSYLSVNGDLKELYRIKETLDAALFGGDSEMEFEELDSIDWSSDKYDDPGENSEPGYFDDPGQF